MRRKFLFYGCVGLSCAAHLLSLFAISISGPIPADKHHSSQRIATREHTRKLQGFITKKETMFPKHPYLPNPEPILGQVQLQPSIETLLTSSYLTYPNPQKLSSIQKILPSPIPPPKAGSSQKLDQFPLYLHQYQLQLNHEDTPPTLLASSETISNGVLSFPLSNPSLPTLQEKSEKRTLPSSQTKTSLPELVIRQHIPSFPSLKQFDTIAASEQFETEVTLFPSGEEGESFFAITLIPKPEITLPAISQHYHFLIDCSNSMETEKLISIKKATLKAIEELKDSDYFNIITFDSNTRKLFPSSKPVTHSSLQAAYEFLQNATLGSFFTVTNLYKPLVSTIPWNEDPTAVHTAILYTDAETLSHPSIQQELAVHWTLQNQGKLSLFSIGLGDEHRLATLEAICSFNRGKMIPCSTKTGIKRKLLKLMKSIQKPIIKTKGIKVISVNSTADIPSLIEKNSNELPHFYAQEPYVILGKTKTLAPFVLFIQGQGSQNWIHIKKEISLANAKKGTLNLKKEWALHNCYKLYQDYLFKANTDALAKAKEILTPYHIPVAFQ